MAEKTVVLNKGNSDDVTVRMEDVRDDTDVTMRIPQAARSKSVDPFSEKADESDHGALTLPSTRVLNYLMGKKLRNVDDELDTLSSCSKAAGAADCDPDRVNLKKADGNYTICETIGEGGQGIVTRAYDNSLQRSVALKSLRRELTDNKVSRRSFIREALLTASLDYPSIIPVYSLNTDDENGLHLAMKVLNGKSLKEHLNGISNRYERFGVAHFDENESLNYRLDIFLRVCETMAYAHQKKVIHCDLKPENIMIGEYRETYVVDWGIAERIDQALAADRKIMGTPRYTSPENLSGVRCDPRSDIYSLGVILFELVTLTPAFSGKDMQEIINHVRCGKCNELKHKFGVPVAKDLAAIVRKAMSLDPAARYQRVEELIADLRCWMRGAEVSANPDDIWGGILRWSNHHRRLVLGGAALIAISSISLSIIGSYAQFAHNAELDKRQEMVVNYAYSKMRKVAEAGTVQQARISDMLQLLSSNAALLLDLNEPVKQSGIPGFIDGFLVGKNKGGDQRLLAHNLLGGEVVDINHVSSSTPWRNDPERAPKFSREKELLRPIIPALRQAVLQSIPGSFQSDMEELIAEYRSGELPVVKSYLCLKSSSIFCYPALAHMEGGYDGTKRPWYLLAEKKRQGPVWGDPYQDSGDAGVLMTTCSMAVVGAKNDFYGVAALDVPLAVFERQLCREPELAAYVLKRQIVDGSGAVLVDVRSLDGKFIAEKNSRFENGKLVFPDFPESTLLKQMRAGRFGSRITKEDGRKILWIYSSARALNWLYVEKIDLDALMNFAPALH